MKKVKGARIYSEIARPIASPRPWDELSELTVVGARVVQSHLAVRAVGLYAGAAASFNVCISRMAGRPSTLSGVFEGEVLPVPSRRSGVAELLEELDGDAGLHAFVSTIGTV